MSEGNGYDGTRVEKSIEDLSDISGGTVGIEIVGNELRTGFYCRRSGVDLLRTTRVRAAVGEIACLK